MEVIAKIMSCGDLTTFATEGGNQIQKIELQLNAGLNQFICAAFDKMALELSANKPIVNAVYVCDLSFSISGKERNFQNVRLVRIAPLF